LVAPVAAIGLDEVAREDLTGGEVDDGDLALIVDGQDPTTATSRSSMTASTRRHRWAAPIPR